MGIELRLRGTAGDFVLPNGSRLPSGPFRIEQTNSGRTFLYCERTPAVGISAALGGLLQASFQGQTAAGQFIRTGDGPNGYVDEPAECCLALRNVEVGQVGVDGDTHFLSLTNLRFPSDNPGSTAFTVSWGGIKIPLRLSPRRNYMERIRRLAKTEHVMPTATLRFRAPNLDRSAIGDFITDLCLALSLIQGKKINWIYHATYGPRRTFQHAVFGETVCKADRAWPLCFNPKMRTGVTPALAASKDALPRIKRFRETYDPHNRLINAWLDAKTETDYLEGRTLKYVVVIEALNAITAPVANISTKIHKKAVWKQLHRKLTEALPGEPLLPTLESWQRLNEKFFRDLLAEVCEHHNVTVQPLDLKLFKSIRDNIVHRFSYDPEIKLPSEWSILNEHQVSQHSFAAWFVDRIILQLFGINAN